MSLVSLSSQLWQWRCVTMTSFCTRHNAKDLCRGVHGERRRRLDTALGAVRVLVRRRAVEMQSQRSNVCPRRETKRNEEQQIAQTVPNKSQGKTVLVFSAEAPVHAGLPPLQWHVPRILRARWPKSDWSGLQSISKISREREQYFFAAKVKWFSWWNTKRMWPQQSKSM